MNKETFKCYVSIAKDNIKLYEVSGIPIYFSYNSENIKDFEKINNFKMFLKLTYKKYKDLPIIMINTSDYNFFKNKLCIRMESFTYYLDTLEIK